MIVVADTGPLISLAIVDKLNVLDSFFDNIFIAEAVWIELLNYAEAFEISHKIEQRRNKVVKISNPDKFSQSLDKGEAESIFLYKEIKADYLLIDDKRARIIAQSFSISCIGTLAILIKAKEKGLISELRSIFIKLINNKRYYSISLLNEILQKNNEDIIRQ